MKSNLPFKEIMDMRCDKTTPDLGRNAEGYPSVKGTQRKNSLQAENADRSPNHPFLSRIRRVFLCISKGERASLTVEAAIALPVFLLTLTAILGILDVYRVQAQVKTSLHETAMELGMYAYAAKVGEDPPMGIVTSAVCAAYGQNRIPDLGRYVAVSTAGSLYQDHQVWMRAQIMYRIPLSVIPLPPIRLYNESRVNSWVGAETGKHGYGETGDEDAMVYVSEYESVYHTSEACTHLDLTVHQADRQDMDALRNAYGGKYHVCEKCGNFPAKGGQVYYSEKGNSYHFQKNCAGLKRTVRLVSKSQLSGKHECERCQKRKAG